MKRSTEKKKNIPSKNPLNNPNNTHNPRAHTSSPPAKLTPLVQSPGLVPQHRAQADDKRHVGGGETLGLTLRKLRNAGQQPVVGAGGLFLGGLLLLAGLLARRGLLLLALDAGGLGGGLDVLV